MWQAHGARLTAHGARRTAKDKNNGVEGSG